MTRTGQIGGVPAGLGALAQMAFRHIEAEDRGDIEATLATFEDDASFELYPCGLQLSGRERIRRYYEQFFAVARPRCTGYTVHGQAFGESSLTVEITVTVAYPDGSRRDFRTMTVFPYGSTALRGERIYADVEFFRVIFGPLLAEMEPLPVSENGDGGQVFRDR